MHACLRPSPLIVVYADRIMCAADTKDRRVVVGLDPTCNGLDSTCNGTVAASISYTDEQLWQVDSDGFVVSRDTGRPKI
jgi:hypothetical protein